MRIPDLFLVIAVIIAAIAVTASSTTHKIEKRQALGNRERRILPLRARRIRPAPNEQQAPPPEEPEESVRAPPSPPPQPQLTQPRDDESDGEIHTPPPVRRPGSIRTRSRSRLGKRPSPSTPASQSPLEPIVQATTTEAHAVAQPSRFTPSAPRRSRVLSPAKEQVEVQNESPFHSVPASRSPSPFRRPGPQAEEPSTSEVEEKTINNDFVPLPRPVQGTRRARPQFFIPTPEVASPPEELEATTRAQEQQQRDRRPNSRPQQFSPPPDDNLFNDEAFNDDPPARPGSSFRRGRPQAPIPIQEVFVEQLARQQQAPPVRSQPTSRRRQPSQDPDQVHEASEDESPRAYSPPPRRSRPSQVSFQPPQQAVQLPPQQYSVPNRGRTLPQPQRVEPQPLPQSQRPTGSFSRSRPQFPVGTFEDGPVEEEFEVPLPRRSPVSSPRFRPEPVDNFPIEPPKEDIIEEQKITRPPTPTRTRTPQLQPQESISEQTSPPQSTGPKIIPASRPGSTRRFTRPPVTFHPPSPPPIAGLPIGPQGPQASQLQPQPAPRRTVSTTTTTTTTTTRAPRPSTTTTTTQKPRPKQLPKRKDGRVIDYLSDPNFPRELTGVDLNDYPFYTQLPDDITFSCDDRHDGYYASVPHSCQVFHYCSRSVRYDFLCANYTLFDQLTFTCRFVNFVQCDIAEQHYDRNNELYVETTTIPEEEQNPPPKAEKKPARQNNRQRSRGRGSKGGRRTTTTTTTTTTEPPYDEEYDDYYEDEVEQKKKKK